MQLRDSINKTKTFFRRSLTTFKRFLHSPGYQKLPKPPSFYPFFSCGRGRDFHGIDEIFPHHEWQMKKKETQRGNGEEEEGDGQQQQQQAQTETTGVSKEVTFFSFNGEEEKTKMSVSGSCSRKGNRLGLARKMKEMEMVDVGDVDHVLDVEEALHYYSRLTSPVYVGIVDRFFMDMYTDFSDAPPQHRVSGSVLRPGAGRVRRSHRGHSKW